MSALGEGLASARGPNQRAAAW